MDEYIKRESAIEAIMSDPPDAHYQSWYAEKIKAIPAADVAPVRHGKWIKRKSWDFHVCSECSFENSPWNYCPNCGAKMDGGDGNDDAE